MPPKSRVRRVDHVNVVVSPLASLAIFVVLGLVVFLGLVVVLGLVFLGLGVAALAVRRHLSVR